MNKNTDYRIPLVNLKREYNYLEEIIEPALKTVFENGRFILGPNLDEFESGYADYIGSRYCIGTGSGTTALMLALSSLGIKAGDRIIIPAFTFKATAVAVLNVGAIPVLADVERDTGNISIESLAVTINKDIKAVIPVHMYGHPADMDNILEITDKLNIPVIEDACEAHGAVYKNRKAGSMGKCGAFSFYPSKNLGGCGDGGAITTDDPEIMSVSRAMRSYGNDRIPGINSRLSGISAVILKNKLGFLNKWNETRRKIADKYNALLQGLPLETPVEKEYANHIYYLYVIRTNKRDQLLEHLQSAGIEARVHFEKPLHKEGLLKKLGYRPQDFPVAEYLSESVVSLPMHPFLTDDEILEISGRIRKFFKL